MEEDKKMDLGDDNDKILFQTPDLPSTNLFFNSAPLRIPIDLPSTTEILGKQIDFIPPTNQELGKVKKALKPPFYLEILKYILPKEIPNKSYLEKGIIIQITEEFYNFIINGWKGENTVYQKRIKFGREGHINFEGMDKSISRNQFEILFGKKSTKIVCHCPPPKLPTSFLIADEPYYLSKNTVNFQK